MDGEGYFRWLLGSKGLKRATCSSRVSNCAKVERFEGDLDKYYEQDRLAGLIERLSYTTQDEREGVAPKHAVEVSGNMRKMTATLKSAVVLYRDFKDFQHLDVLLASHTHDDAAHYTSHMLWGADFMHRYSTQLESLHACPLFALLVTQVDQEAAKADDALFEQDAAAVFERFSPLAHFAELRHIVDDVVSQGYLGANAYVSVYCAMKILDMARSERASDKEAAADEL